MSENGRNETRADRTEPADDAADPDGDIDAVLDFDSAFTALSHPRRIYLLYVLVNGAGRARLPELSAKIASHELDKPIEEVTPAERKRVHTSLYHSHIPKLADLDVIEYEKREQAVVRPKDVSQVKAVLDGTGAHIDA